MEAANELCPEDLLTFAWQIASGMVSLLNYLSTKLQSSPNKTGYASDKSGIRCITEQILDNLKSIPPP